MILTGPEIRKYAEGFVGPNGERIVIEPFDAKWCGPNSYDVHLGDELRVYSVDNWRGGILTQMPIDPESTNHTNPILVGEDGRWLLRPGRVYLASTREYTETHGFVPMLHGRSSVGRLGLFIHVTAGFGDDGFCGHWTLELVATQPVLVRPGMRIGQLVYHTMQGERQPYQGRYANQPPTPVASRYAEGGGA